MKLLGGANQLEAVRANIDKRAAEICRRLSVVRHPEEPRQRRHEAMATGLMDSRLALRALLTMRVFPERREIGKRQCQRRRFSSGIISGERRRDHAEVADRAGRIAGGLQQLGVRQGDSVCMLMRNDIAFIEAAYAAMRLGAYAVPVNWHFKPEEINYVLKDSGTPVLIGHADMLHPLARRDSRGRHRAQRRRRRRKFSRTTRSIPIISPRLILPSISNPGSSGNRPMTARRCRSRRT